MAEVLASFVTEALLSKLISIACQEINGVWGVKDELTKLHRTLVTIKAVLSDAEKKQVTEEAIRLWLRDLKDVACDVEDIFDEFEYEELRRKVETQDPVQKKVRNIFTQSNVVTFRHKMARKIRDINQKLDEIERDSKRFRFDAGSTAHGFESIYIKDRPETSGLVIDSDVVGREVDKSMIIDLLTNSSNNQEMNIYSVVRIVGIGGVGKTTLAKLVYNDKLVKDHFDERMWTCVSQYSTEKEIYCNLLDSIFIKETNVRSLNAVVNTFKRSVENKRYLIVLDDMWKNGTNIYWPQLFKDLLNMGAKGSKIIVTARSDEAIPLVPVYTHRLAGLSKEECWCLFERIAFGHGGAEKTPNLIDIGKQIVSKCGGLPLAASTLGGMMFSKRREGDWLSILNKEIWSLPDGEEKIISVLRLSYDHLPAYLKQCFSYCSIFPKDHNIEKMKLIQLWMAEGFLSYSNESKLRENIDAEYFDILLQNSFLEVEERNKWGDVKSYKMHDLVHDLALSIVGTEFSTVDANGIQEEKNITRLRHVRLVSEDKLSSIPEEMCKARKLRTFVTSNLIYGRGVVKKVSNDMLRTWSCLRVLDLSHTRSKSYHHQLGN